LEEKIFYYYKKYFHQLVDSWQYRDKLRYSEHANLISLEDWWHLETHFDHLTRLYVNFETEEKVKNIFIKHMNLKLK
jgi:hypothetical protein